MEKTSLYQTIYDELLHGIKNGHYPPGSKLPSESELAQSYQVSRITSKKALEMLADQKLIERKPGKGSFVLDKEKDQWNELDKEENTVRDINVGSKLIGVVMDSFGGSFGTDILMGIEKESRQEEFHVLLKCSHGNKDLESESIKSLLALGVSGIIMMCIHDENYNSEVLKLSLDNFPVVLVDRQLKGIPIPYVGTDNYKAAKELTEYLIQKGHTHICYTAPKADNTSSIADRHKGYIDCHMEHGMIINESLWVTDIQSTLPLNQAKDLVRKDLHRIKEFILNHHEVTAFFAVENEIAQIIYSTLQELGLEKEKEIVCFDNTNKNSYFSAFTHVKQNQLEIGRECVRVLKNAILGNDNELVHLVPYEILYKERC